MYVQTKGVLIHFYVSYRLCCCCSGLYCSCNFLHPLFVLIHAGSECESQMIFVYFYSHDPSPTLVADGQFLQVSCGRSWFGCGGFHCPGHNGTSACPHGRKNTRHNNPVLIHDTYNLLNPKWDFLMGYMHNTTLSGPIFTFQLIKEAHGGELP